MIHIDLLDHGELLGFIILCESGVTYANQVGGVMCGQRQAQGAYVPLDAYKPPHYPDNCGSINADDFDLWLEQDSNSPLCGWKVDRSKHSEEAWVFITDGEHEGILTYSNCD